jgi:hypothetical protein
VGTKAPALTSIGNAIRSGRLPRRAPETARKCDFLMLASWPLFAVLGSAFVYTIAALCAKRALMAGATVWQVNFAANMSMAVLYLPFWLGADLPKLLSEGFKPIFAAGHFSSASSSPLRHSGRATFRWRLLFSGPRSFCRLSHRFSLRRASRREMVVSGRCLHVWNFPGHGFAAADGRLDAALGK